MKQLLKSQVVKIPEGIEIEVSRRCISVKGPRGTLTRRFTHFNCDIYKTPEGNVKVDCWFASKKKSASVKTICSIINNLITGVTKGFEYHMRLVYAHYPINAIIPADQRSIQIKNFLGEKLIHRIQMLDGVTIDKPASLKDELVLQGNDIDMVSLSAALINQSCKVRSKDIRKILDGIYVSDKKNVEVEA